MSTRRSCPPSVRDVIISRSIRCAHLFTEGYINESGTINVKRLQVSVNEMANWERGVFEKEYADVSWYKGKQAKHMKEIEQAKKHGKASAC